MNKFFWVTLLLVGLAGCASAPPSPYGNFVPYNMTHDTDMKIIDDVVQKLVELYPPASTRFDLQHTNTDFFGTHLVETMRTKGYAVQEIKAAPKPTMTPINSSSDIFSGVQAEPKPTVAVVNSPPVVLSTPGGLSLSYIMDQTKDSDLYRITLLINQQSLSRVYQLKDDTIFPASYWIRKE